jgi:putative beta-lysine N-acetyltransferase
MKLDKRDLPGIVGKLDSLAARKGYTKLFAKVPAEAEAYFVSQGYLREASIPGFYQGKEDALFLGKYLDPSRAEPGNREELAEVRALAEARSRKGTEKCELPFGFSMLSCAPENAEAMSRVYQTVFPSYPFPIHDPGYLKETMRSHVDYFGILRDGELVALSSAEMDIKGSNVEMTDFATLAKYRGRGLAGFLLQEMEKEMKLREMRTAYTIARAVSPGMNITFSRRGYFYGGTLVNNTQISGRIESMNIWYKWLRAQLEQPE